MKWSPDYQLRDYQRRFCRAVVDAFNNGVDGEIIMRILAVAATGAGKTIMAAAYMLERILRAKARCLMLADRDELVAQAAEKFHKCTGGFADIEKAESRCSTESEVVIGSVQSMAGRRLEDFAPDRFTDIICDEAHLSLAPNWQRVLSHFPNARILGITATPGRGDNKPLMGFYQHLAANIGLFELIAKRALVPIKIRTVGVSIDVKKARPTGGENDDLAEEVEPYWEKIVDAWEAHASDRQTLWFLPSCKSSARFAEYMKKRGHTSGHVQGDSPDRAQVIRAFADRRIRNLSNAQLLTTGFDCPPIQCIVNLSPDRSRTLYQQKIGRGTRLDCPHKCQLYCNHAEAKRNLLVLDFMWQFAELGKAIDVMGPADLGAENKEQRKALQEKLAEEGELDLLVLDEEVTDEREQAMIKAMKYAVKHGNRVYDARLVAAVCDIPDLMDYEPVSKIDLLEPTPRQVEWLAGKGINPDSIKSRGHARAVTDLLMARIKDGKASVKQICSLVRQGHHDASQLTFEMAGERLSALNANKPWRQLRPHQ